MIFSYRHWLRYSLSTPSPPDYIRYEKSGKNVSKYKIANEGLILYNKENYMNCS